jgi:hypothetical protein
MDPELKRLLTEARAALKRGVAREDVDAHWAKVTNGVFKSHQEVEDAIPGHGAADFGRMAVHGVTLGLDEPIAGFIQKLRGRKDNPVKEERKRIVEEHPIASRVAEGVGASLLPLGGAASMLARYGIPAAAATGAGLGAASAGIPAALEAEGSPGERLKAAGLPTAIGGALGLLGGAVAVPAADAAPSMRGATRPGRVAAALTHGTGFKRQINKAIAEAEANIKQVRAEQYVPLEKLHKVVDVPEIRALVVGPLADEMKTVAPQVAKGRAPSFTQLQGLQSRYRGLIKAAGKAGRSDLVQEYNQKLGMLTEATEKALPGVREANAAYAEASAIRRGLSEGRKLAKGGASADDIARVAESYTSPASKSALRRGMVYQHLVALQKKDKGSGEALARFVFAGPEGKESMRMLFEAGQAGDEKFGQFLNILRVERRADRLAKVLIALGGFATTGTAVGATMRAFGKE